jgi:branched-chain amino acid transport system ATP-binding protein
VSGRLEISGLRRAFYGVEVLRGVDVSVREGSFTGLIGPNGAGKSTLFNVVSGLYPAEAGSVRFGGMEITNSPPEALAEAGLARSFQLARGFPKLTVFQHLMLHGQRQPGDGLLAALSGSRRMREAEARLADHALSIARRLKLAHVIDNPVTALSGGQKKLLEIGRALMSEPRMILLDEPMAGVNPSLVNEIGDHLTAINREGITILLIEHDMALIRRLCDPVIVMANGRVMAEGRFDEIAARVDVQEAYLGRRH